MFICNYILFGSANFFAEMRYFKVVLERGALPPFGLQKFYELDYFFFRKTFFP